MIKIGEKVVESCGLLMWLQNQKKKKRDTKVSYIVKRRKKIKRMQTKEVHNEVSSRKDYNERRYICQVMCSTSLLDSLLYPCIFSFLIYLPNNPIKTFIKDLMIHVHDMI